jgi:hypothetical protein
MGRKTQAINREPKGSLSSLACKDNNRPASRDSNRLGSRGSNREDSSLDSKGSKVHLCMETPVFKGNSRVGSKDSNNQGSRLAFKDNQGPLHLATKDSMESGFQDNSKVAPKTNNSNQTCLDSKEPKCMETPGCKEGSPLASKVNQERLRRVTLGSMESGLPDSSNKAASNPEVLLETRTLPSVVSIRMSKKRDFLSNKRLAHMRVKN